MSQTWGRTDSAGTWPHPKPVWTLATLRARGRGGRGDRGLSVRGDLDAAPALVSPVVSPQRGDGRPRRSPPPAAIGCSRSSTGRGAGWPSTTRSRPVTDRHGRGRRLRSPRRRCTLGDRRLVWQDAFVPPRSSCTRSWAAGSIAIRRLTDLLMPAVWGGRGRASSLGLLIAIPRDLARSRERRHGRRLKGPELVTAGAVQPPHARRRHRLPAAAAPRWRRTPWVRIPRAHRVEPSPHHGRLRHREVGAHPADVAAARRPRRDGHRLRSRARIHAAVLHARPRRRHPQSARRAESLLESRRRSGGTTPRR